MATTPLPARPSVVSHVVSILKTGLGEGRWGDCLPGERRMSVQLGVSRPTLRKALEKLRGDGLLKVARGKASRPTRKATRRAAVAVDSRTVVALAPEPLHRLPSAAVFTFDELRLNLAEAGLRLDVRAFRPPRRQFASALEALLRTEHAAVWLLYQQEPAVHRWFRERALPCVIFGTQDRSFPLPAVDLDQRATSRHAAQIFQRCGYAPGMIALVVPDNKLSGHVLMGHGLRDALGDEARTFTAPLDPVELLPALDRILTEVGKPAALIFARVRHAAAALGHFAIRRRLRVPEDVALICLNDDPFLRYLQPQIARYQRDEGALARQLSALVVRAATGSGMRPRMTLLMPDFVRGETIPVKRILTLIAGKGDR